MADEQKKVEYSFTGNIESLQDAVKSAINILGKYEKTVKEMTKAGQFEVSKTAFSSFNKTVNGIIKQVNSLVKSLNTASESTKEALVPDTDKVVSATKDISDSLDMLQKSTKVTSKDIKFLTEYLKDTQSTLTAVADKAKILGSTFNELGSFKIPKIDDTAKTQIEDIAQATKNASSTTNTSVDGMSSAYRRLVENAPFINYARQVEESYGRVNKSAKESAEVLASVNEVKFEDKLESVRTKSTQVADGIRNAFSRLSNIFEPVTSATAKVTSSLQSFKDKASNVLDHVRQMAIAAGTGFRQFKGDAEAAGDAASTGNLVQSLRNAIRTMTGVSAAADKKSTKLQKETEETESDEKATNKLITVLKVLSKVASTAGKVIGTAAKATAKVTGIFINLSSNVKAATKAFDSLKKKTNDTSKDIKSLIGLIGALGIGKALGDATKKSIEFIENLNLFTVSMGESVDEAQEFIDKMSEIYGMDPSNLYRYSGYFYQLTDAIGTTAKASKIMSLSLTKASNDIASLFNVDIETVTENLSSGMQGMSRAVRKYGMDIRNTTLKQTALNYGFKENIATTSEANRMALRYLTMMQQVKNATSQVTETVDGANKVIGDFARNIETPANQLRILKEQISQVARAIGNFFIPLLQKTLYVINGILMAIKELLLFLASLLGIDVSGFGGEISSGANDAADAVSGIGDAADDTAKKLKNLIAPFDELTILTEPVETNTDSGLLDDALDPALLAAIEAMQLGLDDIRMKALDVRDKILELLGLQWDEDGNLVPVLGGFVDDLIKLWDNADYEGFGSRVAEFFNQGIEWGIENTDPSKYAEGLNAKVKALAELLNGFVKDLNWEGLGTIIGNGITLALGMINTFLETFDWYTLGVRLAQGLNGIINAVDWDLLGRTIGNYFMAKVRELQGFIDSFDWEGLGHRIAVGLTSAVNTIHWNEVGSMLGSGITGVLKTLNAVLTEFNWRDLGNKFAQGLNNLISGVNWDLLGQTIGNFFAAQIRVVEGVVERFNWIGLGANLGKALMNALNAIPWSEMGHTLATSVNGIITTIQNFLATYDWGTFGRGVATYISVAVQEINWRNLGAAISNVVKALLQETITYLSTLDWYSVGRAVGNAFAAIDWLGIMIKVCEIIALAFGAAIQVAFGAAVGIIEGVGRNIIEGFQNGILAGAKNIGSWIQEHLIDPLVNTVKNLLGIHSPSTVFAEIGGDVIAGLFNGLLEGIRNIGNWLKQNLIDPVVNAVKNGFKEDIFKSIGSSVANGFMSGLQTLGSKVTSWGSQLRSSITSILSSLRSQVTSFSSSIQSSLSSLVSSVSSRVSSISSSVSSAISSARSSLSSFRGPKMASGGVVRGPTHALIGEGQYNEAVIPLGNSPELQEMIDKIANAVSATHRGGNDVQTPIEVHVYLDGTEITTTQNRANRMYGRTQQKV